MAKLYDISDWNEQPWWNTGGTRNKKVYLNPKDGELYYFKESFNKGKRDYTYEFWSEIVASAVGDLLGLDVLPYHIAINDSTSGCISKSMIDPAREELVEGGKYLQAFDSTFDPENRKLRHQYDFQLILGALQYFNLEQYYGQFIDTLIFDAFIGNSDRHQENWAMICRHTGLSRAAADLEKLAKSGIKDIPKLVRGFFEKMMSGKNIEQELKVARLALSRNRQYSPIYDNGCSFGRELSEEKVRQLLHSDDEAQKYLNKGLAEIHWEGEKINHFELILKIGKNEDFNSMVTESLDRVLQRFDKVKIKEFIEEVDKPLREMGYPDLLPQERKDLMFLLLTLRCSRLRRLLEELRS